jgi:hypothetical protein
MKCGETVTATWQHLWRIGGLSAASKVDRNSLAMLAKGISSPIEKPS